MSAAVAAVVFTDVAFAYVDSVSLLTNVSLRLERGFTAVVGANGAGKTTLLALASLDLEPTEGRVRLEPPGALVVRCPQVVDVPTAEVHAFAAGARRRCTRLRRELCLDGEQLRRWSSLSPGERKRWQVGAALSQDPDVLLLDEPTNHLDASARGLLGRVLGRFRGVGLVVSHDRALLDSVALRTAWVEGGRVRLFDGGYGPAAAVRASESRSQERDHDRARAAARKSARAFDAKQRARAAACRNVGARKRIKGPRDSDARSVNRKARAAKAEAAHAKGVRRLATRRDRDREAAAAARFDRSLGGGVALASRPAREGRLACLVLDELRAGPRRLLGPLSRVIDSGSRIRITGDNGAGKSTLLAAVVAVLPAEGTFYLPQELGLRERRAAATRIRSLGPAERGRALAIVGALGSEPRRLLATDLPSPGEAKKLSLAEALGRETSCLVLDEPTNHLDLPSTERLEEALAEYDGAVILVSHDTWFAERLTTEVWQISEGRLL